MSSFFGGKWRDSGLRSTVLLSRLRFSGRIVSENRLFAFKGDEIIPNDVLKQRKPQARGRRRNISEKRREAELTRNRDWKQNLSLRTFAPKISHLQIF